MKAFTLAVVLVLMAVSAFAADVDGKWAGTVSTPNGDFPQSFTFKADGAMLNGSMAGLDGKDVAIKDGKVDGNNISFTVTLDFGGMAILLSYKGVVDKEQIKLTGDFMGMPFDLVVKKSS
ncbi:MAG TPA: hypothetical protein VLY24_10050 [Bryobacteraceae bacterium]|nr:hypothetical protein [Bryobacteraceae bacterium]